MRASVCRASLQPRFAVCKRPVCPKLDTFHSHALLLAGALQAPGLPYQLPRQLAGYPALTGRAIVELTVEKAGGEKVCCASSASHVLWSSQFGRIPCTGPAQASPAQTLQTTALPTTRISAVRRSPTTTHRCSLTRTAATDRSGVPRCAWCWMVTLVGG